ncbi:MAG: single-stranded DNA-binding protein [Acidimicrobiales bacterium]
MGFVNVVVLSGRLSRPAESRVLPSGDQLVAFEVTIPRDGQRAETVPVAWFGAPSRAAEMGVGDEVLAVGRVRRRFWRGAGNTATQSRTEVVADAVVPLSQAMRCRNALIAAMARAEDAVA